MIKAWKTSGVDQTTKAQVYYDVIEKNGKAQFIATRDALDKYIKRHPNRRLEVRIIMYKVLGNWMFGLMNDLRQRTALMIEAIKKAYPLQDDQLNSELYALYADNASEQYDFYLYNLKALELQKQIGVEHFFYVQNRYYNLSQALYQSYDFTNCIKFGKEFLRFEHLDTKHWNPFTLILQLDLISSAYRHTGDYDSSYVYSKMLLDSIGTRSIINEYLSKNKVIWTGIAEGGMGIALVAKGNFDEAKPLLQSYLNMSIETKDSSNLVAALNGLAKLHFAQKQYPQAVRTWQQAMKISRITNSDGQIMYISKDLSAGFKAVGQLDSSLYYYDLFNKYDSALQDSLKKIQFADMKRVAAFDELQSSLQKTQTRLERTRLIRNIVVSIILLALILVLVLHHRKMQRKRLQITALKHKNKLAKQEIDNAKASLEEFRRNLQHKNELIESLYQKLNTEQILADKKSEDILGNGLVTNEEWENFRKQFDKAYPMFFIQLNQVLKEQSTPAIERLSALISLRFTNKEIAGALGIAPDSVARSKRRLRVILNLPSEKELDEYISKLSDHRN